MKRTDGVIPSGTPRSSFSYSLITAAAVALLAGFSMPTGPAAAQEDVSFDLFGGATAPVGGLAEVTTGPAWHAGVGLSFPVSDAWGLRAETSLHEFTERRFSSTPVSGGEGSGFHLQLWQFFLLAERGLVSSDDLRIRVRAGLGATQPGSDQVVREGLLTSRAVVRRRLSGLEPAVQVGADAGYRVGPGEVFVRAGTIVTGLPGGDAAFYRDLSNGEVGDLHALISVPVSAGVRLRF